MCNENTFFIHCISSTIFRDRWSAIFPFKGDHISKTILISMPVQTAPWVTEITLLPDSSCCLDRPMMQTVAINNITFILWSGYSSIWRQNQLLNLYLRLSALCRYFNNVLMLVWFLNCCKNCLWLLLLLKLLLNSRQMSKANILACQMPTSQISFSVLKGWNDFSQIVKSPRESICDYLASLFTKKVTDKSAF